MKILNRESLNLMNNSNERWFDCHDVTLEELYDKELMFFHLMKDDFASNSIMYIYCTTKVTLKEEDYEALKICNYLNDTFDVTACIRFDCNENNVEDERWFSCYWKSRF